MSDNRTSVTNVCRRSLEMSCPCPLEMSGFKDGLISMRERDLKGIEVLSEVRTGRRTVAAAAAVLAASERQAYRLLARYERDGGSGLIHKAQGRTSNRSRNEGTHVCKSIVAAAIDSASGQSSAWMTNVRP